MNTIPSLKCGNLITSGSDISKLFNDIIPYTCNDTTAGLENEFQTSVSGNRNDVDLPSYIEKSGFLKNLIKRVERGDANRNHYDNLMDYLNNNQSMAWENSWVRFPYNVLSPFATRVFQRDLRKDKSDPMGPQRSDIEKFIVKENGREYLRVPVSYLLKLSLADSVSGRSHVHPLIRKTGEMFLDSYLNDNTSPEIVSFFPVKGCSSYSVSENLSRQNRKNYLLTQLLVLYANKKFELSSRGQDVSLYYSPHPPVRQKKLNEYIPDSFYRELYMSPCLSGWDRGEEKHAYMELCHQVLSRSSLNAIFKLKEAGIVSDNRVFLKGISNISLANNGTHISIGSSRISALLSDSRSGFTPLHEKYCADLSIKIFEHFLPLFVGTYTASPYRLNFSDFHPELAMGFMAHELDFTHLRMIWRRWRKKAKLSLFGNSITPTGNESFDRFLAKTFRLRGDYISDSRLIDYLVALLSTDESPALNGIPGNDLKLKADLCSMGIFDKNMSVYMLYKMRAFETVGYSGFEGRHYSLFPSLETDLKQAIDIQILITSLAYKYIMNNTFTHLSIPDSPEIESERRQAVFGSAIGLPTFYVKKETKNDLMRKIVSLTNNTRVSNRYRGYVRIKTGEYKRALLKILKEDGSDLIEMLGIADTVRDLELRIKEPEMYSASARISRGICEKLKISDPLKVEGDSFNCGTEDYYRNDLRKMHIDEGMSLFAEDMEKLKSSFHECRSEFIEAVNRTVNMDRCSEFIEDQREKIKDGTVSLLHLRSLIHILLLGIHHDMGVCSAIKSDMEEEIKLTV